MDSIKKHWIFRINDGENFKNSKFPFWGVKRGHNNCIKGRINKMKQGDICWFITSKKFGGKILGMAEFINYYDRKDEPLIQINTLSNKEQNWSGDELWDIQIHYCNLYITEKQNITGCIQHSSTILDYESFKNKINGDLYEHYKNFKYYAEPKNYN